MPRYAGETALILSGATNVPLPGTRTRRPSAVSFVSTPRTVIRLSPKCRYRSFSEGIRSFADHSPLAIFAVKMSSSCW